MSRRASTLPELVARYVSELAQAWSGRRSDPTWATDLGLYNGHFQLWFDDAMLFWARYVADMVSSGPLAPPLERAVVRYVPLKAPKWRSISEAQEYWLRVRVGMHWLLAPGPTNLITFGTLDRRSMNVLDYAVVPKTLLIESAGLFDGDFDTRVTRGVARDVVNRADFIESLFTEGKLDDLDVCGQEVFPLYYRTDTFRAERQDQGYLRNVMGRFLWKLQEGICPACGLESRYEFDQMQVDHIIPVARGGNNTLLNTEMKCRDHNLAFV